MARISLSSRRASAQGAVATGSAATGALALGALAVGAAAIGALAIGRLVIGRAKFGRVEIGELVVRRFDIGSEDMVVTRIRAAAGKGDAMERLLREQAHISGVKGTLRRSADDPDLFVQEHRAGPHDAWLEAVKRRAVAEGLVEADGDDAVTEERLVVASQSPAI